MNKKSKETARLIDKAVKEINPTLTKEDWDFVDSMVCFVEKNKQEKNKAQSQ